MNDNDIRSSLTEEERQRLEKIDKIDANQKRKKLILAAVTAALILIFALGTVFGAKYILSYEGTAPMPGSAEEITPPAEKGEVLADIAAMESAVKSINSVKLNKKFSVSVPGDSISIEGGSKDLPGYIDFIRNSLVDIINDSKNESAFSGTFGDDFSAQLPSLSFDPAKALTAECAVSEDDHEKLEYTLTFADFRLEDIPSLPFAAALGLENSKKTVESIKTRLAPAADVKNITVEYTEPAFTAVIAAVEKRPEHLEGSCVCLVSADVDFKGVYAALGSAKISFTLNQSVSYDFTFAGLKFNSDVFYFSKGDSDELKYTVTTDLSPSEIKIDWRSSDPSVLSIDGNFYKAHRVSDSPVTITGTFSYCGEVYTAQCLCWVREELTDVKLSTKQLTLTAGETAALGVTFKPGNATVKTVRWFSDDESIAKVDENGNITGIAPGETAVFLISEDGNFKRSCTVTVTASTVEKEG